MQGAPFQSYVSACSLLHSILITLVLNEDNLPFPMTKEAFSEHTEKWDL